jgi:DNA topoisomerase IB
MPAVLIYSQKNLEYIVLSNRRIFSKDKDLVRPIANADKHVFWTDLEHRKHIQKEGERFFKQHEDYLGTPPSMDDVDGKMSPGFFLYLTFLRFQGQVYQASIVRNSDINKLTKEKSEFNDNLAKLLTLQTAMEHLVKTREYIKRRKDAPEGADVQTGSRGGLWYDPDTVTVKEQQGDMPTKTREVDVVQAARLPAAKTADKADIEEDDDKEESSELVEGFVPDEVFMEQMKEQGFVAVNPDDKKTEDYLGYLNKTITLDEKTARIEEEAIKLRVPATELVPIEPNLKIADEEGNIVQITTTDGQILAVQKIDTSAENIKKDDKGNIVLTKNGDPKFINPRGKLHLHVNPNAPNDDPLDPDDHHIQYSYHDGLRNKKSGYSLKYSASQEIYKFDKIAKLVPKISLIRKAVKADFADPTRNRKKYHMNMKSVTEASLALALILDTARRIGGPSGASTVTADGKEGRPGPTKDDDDNFIRVEVPTYGVTTIKPRHIKVKGGKVSLEFIGKSGKTNYVDIKDKMVATELAKRRKTFKKDQDIIEVGAGPVSKYLKAIAGDDFSPKNFRTYQGTLSAAEILDTIKEIPSHFGKYPMIRYGTKTVDGIKIPVEEKSTWGAEFNSYMTKQMKEGGITNTDEYQRLGLLWLLKSQHISRRDFVGLPVSEKLSNTPDMSLTKYINPVVFDDAGWNAAFHIEQEEFLKSGAPRNLAALIKKAQKPKKRKTGKAGKK